MEYTCGKCSHIFNSTGPIVFDCPRCGGMAEPTERPEIVHIESRPEALPYNDLQSRLAIIRIPYNEVLCLIRFSASKLPDRIAVPVFQEVPEDVDVVAVQHDFHTRTFEFLIRHPLFGKVVAGDPIPVLGIAGEMTLVELAKEFDGATGSFTQVAGRKEPPPPGMRKDQ